MALLTLPASEKYRTIPTMKNIALTAVALLLTLSNYSHADRSLSIPSQILSSSARTYAPSGSQPSYFSVDLPYSPVESLRNQLESVLRTEGLRSEPLRHRGEAHITILVPDEMSRVLQALPYSQIIEIANRHQILTSPFQITCLGRGKQTRRQTRLHTYYLVVEFPQLRAFRSEVAERVASRNPQLYSFA